MLKLRHSAKPKEASRFSLVPTASKHHWALNLLHHLKSKGDPSRFTAFAARHQFSWPRRVKGASAAPRSYHRPNGSDARGRALNQLTSRLSLEALRDFPLHTKRPAGNSDASFCPRKWPPWRSSSMALNFTKVDESLTV